MDVILLEDVEKLGLRGEVVSVSRGYMRNYLQPRKLAENATEAKVTELTKREAERARHEARTADQAEAIAETLRKTVLRFEVNAGERGTLFGSVTSTDITDELWRARKIRVDRRKIDLSDPIKRIGRYEIPITVFEGVVVDVKTLVVPIGGELPPEEELEAYAAEEAAEAEAAAEADRQAAAEAQAAIEEVVEVKTLVVPIGGELPPEEELEAYAAEEAAEAEAAAEADRQAAAEAQAAIEEVVEAEEGEEAAETATDDAEAVGAEPVEAEAAPEPEASAEPEAPAEPEADAEAEPEDAEAEGR